MNSPNETQSPPKKFSESLFYNYSLNEVKSVEDSAKQLISVNAIVISIYIALIINNQNFEAIRIVTNAHPFGDSSALVVWIFLLAPIGFWFGSMISCIHVLEPKINLANRYLNVDVPSPKVIIDEKFGPFKIVY